MDFVKRHWKGLTAAAAVGGALVVWLAIAVFGIHTLFIDDKVDEAGPVFASGVTGGEPIEDAAAEVSVPPADDPADETAAPNDAAPEGAEIVTVAQGEFVGRSHPGEGQALILNDGTDQRFLRFENFSTDNGPDLNVYLSAAPADADAGAFDDEFVDLGKLKGNIGDQNYEIPADVDVDTFSTVVVWCVRFNVAFTAADLA